MRLYICVEPEEGRREGPETWRRPKPKLTGKGKKKTLKKYSWISRVEITKNSIEAKSEFKVTEVVSTQ